MLAGQPGTAAGHRRSASQSRTASDQARGIHGSGARTGREPLRAPGTLAVHAESSEGGSPGRGGGQDPQPFCTSISRGRSQQGRLSLRATVGSEPWHGEGLHTAALSKRLLAPSTLPSLLNILAEKLL